jgi:hypothetical protein
MKEIKEWEIATNKLTTLFLKKYFDDREYSWLKGNDWADDGHDFVSSDGADDCSNISGYWIGGDVGGVLEVGDYYFGFDRIKEALELDATEEQLFEYYDLEFDRCGKVGYNFKNFIKYGKEQMESVSGKSSKA